MRGFIYLTKEFNSDGAELLHNGLPKIGIGKTNNLNRRFYEHHNKGSKSTTEVDFIKTFEVEDMDKVEKYADSQLSPEDVVLGKETDHFFQRLNDPRNGKEISPAELTGFFKRLAKNKKKFLEFIKNKIKKRLK